ncbi:MAG: VOC family protein [Acidobacteriia bacterium]|nr:VOC family protein [Terriglobia bacterium]
MKTRAIFLAAILAAVFVWWGEAPTHGQANPLPVPGFHHLHLNSTNPELAIAFYVKEFPSTSKTTWGGQPALKSPNNVLVLFERVDMPPATQPQTAVWHFGWHVTNERQAMDRMRKDGVTLLPLYTTEEGGTVNISSDTWPGSGGVLGLTRAGIAEAKAKGVKPAGGAGFAYIRGPDDAMIEVQGDMPAERFNHVHMFQEDPFCAQLWYQKHLNVALPQGRRGAAATPRTEENCQVPRSPDKTWPALEVDGMYRSPSAGVTFGDVGMNWYVKQSDRPLVSTRGHLADHIALSVANLDAWVAKLRGEGVAFLKEPYTLGDTRAVMIEGPSREALELVEVK